MAYRRRDRAGAEKEERQEKMIFEHCCVGFMFLFCFWAGLYASTSDDSAYPFGAWGRGLTIFSSLILGLMCWAVLTVKLIEILK